jgi:protein-tyrosine-phosphatase
MENDRPLSVLFLCTGNSARSQMAEALLRHLSDGEIEVRSAGSAPKTQVHPLVAPLLRDEFGIDATDLFPKSTDHFGGRTFDYVITLCDNAAKACPVFLGNPQRIDWSLEDPANVDGDEEQRHAFRAVAHGLAERLEKWLSQPEVLRHLRAR